MNDYKPSGQESDAGKPTEDELSDLVEKLSNLGDEDMPDMPDGFSSSHDSYEEEESLGEEPAPPDGTQGSEPPSGEEGQGKPSGEKALTSEELQAALAKMPIGEKVELLIQMVAELPDRISENLRLG